MELAALLAALDRAAANLEKLEAIWRRAQPFIPTGPSAGSEPEYDDLQRAWTDLLPWLPKINGWTITNELPDIDAHGRAFVEYLTSGRAPHGSTMTVSSPVRTLPSTATA